MKFSILLIEMSKMKKKLKGISSISVLAFISKAIELPRVFKRGQDGFTVIF